MRCLFCAEEIKDEATVCKHCHRDLSIVKPLMDQNAALTKRIDELQTEVSQLRTDLGEVRRMGRAREAFDARHTLSYSAILYWRGYLARYVLLPVLLLLLAHYLMNITFNIPLIYLRVVSLAIGFGLGYSMFWRTDDRLGTVLVVGSIVAIVTVMSMSIVVLAIRGGGTIAPANQTEWRDVFEYSIGIVLASVTGNVIANFTKKTFPQGADPKDGFAAVAKTIARIIGPTYDSKTAAERLQYIEKALKAGTAAITAAVALYASIKSAFN